MKAHFHGEKCCSLGQVNEPHGTKQSTISSSRTLLLNDSRRKSPLGLPHHIHFCCVRSEKLKSSYNPLDGFGRPQSWAGLNHRTECMQQRGGELLALLSAILPIHVLVGLSLATVVLIHWRQGQLPFLLDIYLFSSSYGRFHSDRL